MTESVINKPNKTTGVNISKPLKNVTKPIRTLPTINISKPVSPKLVGITTTVVPAPVIDNIGENNSPMTPENEEFAEISIADSEAEAEEGSEEAPVEEVVPVKKTRTKSRSSGIERLLNNPNIKTLIKTTSVAGGGLLGTVFTILIMFKLIKSL